MKFFKRWPVHLLLFLTGFLILNGLVEFVGLKPVRETTVVMYDMKRAENIDIAVLGNSLAGRHVDTSIVGEALGGDCFDLAISSANSLTVYTIAEEMYQYHSPKTVIWIHDPAPAENEALVVEAGVWPHLTSWKRRLLYAQRSSELDGAYLDRFFPWRQDLPGSIKEIQDNIEIKTNLKDYYAKSVELYRSTQGTTIRYYNGKGYRPVYREIDNPRFHNSLTRKVNLPKDVDISVEKDVLLALKDLCEGNGAKLIVISGPTVPQILLGDKKTTLIMDNMKQFCEENDVPYLDMARATPKLLPTDMMPYQYNAWHMVKDGAEIYSKALAKALKDYVDGEDISDYFYTPEEYAETKNYILNGWYTEKSKDGQITYTADCIYGANVEPQYQFSAVDEKGKETLLKGFSKTAKFTCSKEEMEGKEIQIAIRNAAALEQETVIAIKK